MKERLTSYCHFTDAFTSFADADLVMERSWLVYMLHKQKPGKVMTLLGAGE